MGYQFPPGFSNCGYGNGYTQCHANFDVAILWLDTSYSGSLPVGYDGAFTGADNTINTAGKPSSCAVCCLLVVKHKCSVPGAHLSSVACLSATAYGMQWVMNPGKP